MRTEDQIQRSMVEWLERCVPAPPEGPWWTAVNASPVKLGVAKAANQKRMGQKAGTPDLIFCIQGTPQLLGTCVTKPGRLVGVEVKPPGRYLSKVQKAVHLDITLCGGIVHTVHSVEELQNFLKSLGVPLRGRIAA